MIRWLCVGTFMAMPAFAQDFSGLARVDMAQSQIVDADDGLEVTLNLSQTVPYRVFTVADPPRLVVDFREVDWTGVSRTALDNADRAEDVRFGVLRPGWSRLVVIMDGPMVVNQAGMAVDDDSSAARLIVTTRATDDVEFEAKSGVPESSLWGEITPAEPSLAAPDVDNGPLVVVIDPGHGGIDPGAHRGSVIEAKLMLRLAVELADALNRAGGVRAVLTREADVFVPLEARMSIARAEGADLFISLHADALEEDEARGGSVYTLNEEGADRAADRMAERHERGDLLAGVDLSGQGDRVATVLMDMARAETAPQSQRFADAAVAGLRRAGARLNSRPRREGRLAVLNAPDFASVLIEVGFLSSASDRALLTSSEGRATIVRGLVDAVLVWAIDEEIRAPMVRQ